MNFAIFLNLIFSPKNTVFSLRTLILYVLQKPYYLIRILRQICQFGHEKNSESEKSKSWHWQVNERTKMCG